MLSKREKEGFGEILQNLSEYDLIALKDTVTNRLIAARNKPEAIQAILTYTDNTLQLLRRRKLKREFIFMYLARQHVAVSPHADKGKLIRRVLNYWGTNVDQDEDRQLLALEGVDEEYGPNPQPMPATQPPHVHAEPQAASAVVERNFPNNADVAKPLPPVAQQLAKQFVAWFYQQLNALNPHIGGNSEWGPQHFFKDCKLKLNVESEYPRIDAFEGADVVSARFCSLVQMEGLLFNPNMEDDGTKGFTDPHGLAIVCVCGTVHSEGVCLGMFEQRFGLVQDPLNANNWKIKFTDMNVKCESVNQVPKLNRRTHFPALAYSMC